MFRSAWSRVSYWRWRTRCLWSRVQSSASCDAPETGGTGTRCFRARWSQPQGAGRTEPGFYCGGSAEKKSVLFFFFGLRPQRCSCRGQSGQDSVGVLLLWATSAPSHPASHTRISAPLLHALRHGSDCRCNAVSLVSGPMFYETCHVADWP